MTAAEVRRRRILRGMGVACPLPTTVPDGSARRSPLTGARIIHEPLKGENPLTSRKIAFEDQVEVLTIPTRYEYSDRIKSRIWSNRHELAENAERNAMEFAAEGWNWRNVTEDEGMYICSVSGELVHPVHLQHLMDEGPSLERGQPVHSAS